MVTTSYIFHEIVSKKREVKKDLLSISRVKYGMKYNLVDTKLISLSGFLIIVLWFYQSIKVCLERKRHTRDGGSVDWFDQIDTLHFMDSDGNFHLFSKINAIYSYLYNSDFILHSFI